MFTGIIEALGQVKSFRGGSGSAVISVDIGRICEGTKLGDSIAISGVCLTVSKISGTIAEFEVSSETLSRATTGKLRAGSKVNLERAMAADGRFGGHIVQGHVDGLARIRSIDRTGRFSDITFDADSTVLESMIVKGSVAIDGISLTVSKMDSRGFTVAVIPVTLSETTLGSARASDEVNIETDIVIKAVKSHLEQMTGQGKLSAKRLGELGF